jgi:molybdopterin converting factor small subunit
VQVSVRYFAGAAAAAGRDGEDVVLVPGSHLADLAGELGRRHGAELTRVLTACSFLLDEVAGPADRPLHDGAQVDVLPPFAGG